jgi:hypothetical protein
MREPGFFDHEGTKHTKKKKKGQHDLLVSFVCLVSLVVNLRSRGGDERAE